jgi:hypothetical protein
VTASTPTTIDVGLSQLVTTLPAALPSGTRPEAIPPSAVPKKNGVRTEDIANTAPNSRCLDRRCASLRNANPVPRRTMPRAATLSGIDSVVMMEAKAGPNAVHSRTRPKISHMWLISHTGPTARLMSMRGPDPARESPATRSQKPAPESAPPRTA